MLAMGRSQTRLCSPNNRLPGLTLFTAVTLALTYGICLPDPSLHGAKNWNLDPVSTIKELQHLHLGTDLMMTECGSCHRTPEGRGRLEESQWATQTRGLSPKGHAGIRQDEKVEGIPLG